MFPLGLGSTVYGGLLPRPGSPGEHRAFVCIPEHPSCLFDFNKQTELEPPQEKQTWEPVLFSLSILVPHLTSSDEDQQQHQAQSTPWCGIISAVGPSTRPPRRQSGLEWIRELQTAEWRTDLRKALCQKRGQKNKMKHSSGPAGPRQLLANICTFGIRIIVSLLMRYY